MERTHPAEPARAPAHGLWPRKAAYHLGDHFGDHVERWLSRLVDHCDVEIAFLVRLNLCLLDRLKTCSLEKPRNGVLGRTDARPLLFLLDVRLAGRHAMHPQGEPARRAKSLRAPGDRTGRHPHADDPPFHAPGPPRTPGRGGFP